MENTPPNGLPEIVLRSLYWNEENPREKELFFDAEFSLSTGKKIVVPAGFRTDLATVPRLFWSIINPSGAHNAAVVFHDYLLKKGYERLFSDNQMYRVMVMMPNMKRWERRAIYKGCRFWAWLISFKKVKILKH